MTPEQKELLGTIGSTTSITDCCALYDLVLSTPKDAIIVELGTGMGRTACAMAYGCIGTKRKIFTIDSYEESTRYQSNASRFETWNLDEAKKNVQKLDLRQYVAFITAKSTDTSLATTINNEIDMIFIDASHRCDDVKQDILAWKNMIKKQGVMAGHDWRVDCSDGRQVIKAVVETVLSANHPFFVVGTIWYLHRYW